MHFSRFVPAAAGLIGAATATSGLTLGNNLDLSADFDLASSWDAEVLFDGIVKPASETEAAVELSLTLKEAQIEGHVSLSALTEFLHEPTLRLDLAGVKAYVEVQLSASAAVYQTVELIASPGLDIDTGLLDLDLGAAFALDLIVGVDAAIDLCAGFYVSFNEGDYLDLSVITKEIVGKKLDGLVTKALPIGVAAHVDLSAEIEVQLGLRLRSHVTIGAGVDLLGLDLLDASADVAIWADLIEHTITLVETDDCLLSVANDFALSLGVAVDVSASVLDILDLSLAPELTVTLASALGAKVCLNTRGDFCGAIEPPTGPTTTPGLPGTTVTPGVPGTTVTPGNPSTPSGPVDSETPVPSGPATTPGHSNSTIITSASLTTSSATTTSASLITSTATTTKTYTITSCHASVPNCPASQTQKIVTSTIISSVVVCPAESTGLPPSSTGKPGPKPVHTITETLTTVVPCKPTTSTFTPPAGSSSIPPTVIVTGSTTVCPTETGSHGAKPPAPTGGVPSVDVPAGPTSTSVIPTTNVPEVPPTTAVPTVGVPTWVNPGTNSTWTSILPPASTWVPPAASTPGSGTVPSQPPTAGAGSIKVGFALALPAVLAMML